MSGEWEDESGLFVYNKMYSNRIQEYMYRDIRDFATFVDSLCIYKKHENDPHSRPGRMWSPLDDAAAEVG